MNWYQNPVTVGIIGILITILIGYIGYEYFFTKYHNPTTEVRIEEPMFFGIGMWLLIVIFMRMIYQTGFFNET